MRIALDGIGPYFAEDKNSETNYTHKSTPLTFRALPTSLAPLGLVFGVVLKNVTLNRVQHRPDRQQADRSYLGTKHDESGESKTESTATYAFHTREHIHEVVVLPFFPPCLSLACAGGCVSM